MSVTDSLPFDHAPSGPDYSIESRLMREGKLRIAGVDEVGRGPLAGPVVAAAVVLNPESLPAGLNDSKKLSGKTREILFNQICRTAQVSWTSLPAPLIDKINIREAALLAMTRSVHLLPNLVDATLIDGRDVPEGLTATGTALVKGDARSVSIAAASIVAKVIRDRMMVQASLQYPQFGFQSHKGYGSRTHFEAIRLHGPCPLHRMSFSPFKDSKKT